ncbi:MAG: hypothetical protein H6Q72_4952, partial [Firmicutes bacterium]|nr:hypothetical protein [Bacillota bacterium]
MTAENLEVEVNPQFDSVQLAGMNTVSRLQGGSPQKD